MAVKKEIKSNVNPKSVRMKKRQRVFELVDALHTITFSRVFIEDMFTSDTYWISVYLEQESIDAIQFFELMEIAEEHNFALSLANDYSSSRSRIRLWPKADS